MLFFLQPWTITKDLYVLIGGCVLCNLDSWQLFTLTWQNKEPDLHLILCWDEETFPREVESVLLICVVLCCVVLLMQDILQSLVTGSLSSLNSLGGSRLYIRAVRPYRRTTDRDKILKVLFGLISLLRFLFLTL